MMDYNEFQDVIRERILTDWMDDGEVEVSEFYKNNGQKKVAVYIMEAGENASPAIYLERYYDMYQQGYEIPQIIVLIRAEYEFKIRNTPQNIPDLDDYEKMKGKVIFRLVNYEKNRQFLEDCPHIPVFDLAITFRWISARNSEGMASAVVNNRLMEVWGVSLEELLEAAMATTRKLFPPVIREMSDLLGQLADMERGGKQLLREGEDPENVRPEPGNALYVLTNIHGTNGASTLLYESLLADFAVYADSGFYILPSSINELILVSEEFVEDPRDLFEMVSSCNKTVVYPEDLLSDSVYYVDKTSGKIRMLKRSS